jgi:hypothetical protein
MNRFRVEHGEYIRTIIYCPARKGYIIVKQELKVNHINNVIPVMS